MDDLLEIHELTIKGVTFKMRELNFDEAEEHSKRSLELRESNPTAQDWMKFALEELAKFLIEPKMDEPQIRKKLSPKLVNKIYAELFLPAAGLELAKAGTKGGE